MRSLIHPTRHVGSSRNHLVARIITEVLAPAPVVSLLLLVIAWHSTPSLGEAIIWAGLAILFTCVLPILYAVREIRRHRLTDHHISLREQRPLYMTLGMLSVVAGLVLLRISGAPKELVALIGAMIAGLVSSILVTLFWKISIHVAVAAGTVVILALVFGPVFLLLVVLVCLAGWARVELGDHTPAQVVAGGILGASVAAIVFTLLR